MTDRLIKIYVEPTNHCNLNCRFCVRRSWEARKGFMHWPLYESLLENLADFPDVRTLAFAGFGEPLLHPRFVDMIERAHERGIRTEMTSNALLLTSDMARALVNAGLDQFVVSIDAATEPSYGMIRGSGSVRDVINKMRTLFKLSLAAASVRPAVTVGIEFVAMKGNIKELPLLKQIATQIGASFIIISNMLPYTKEMEKEILYHRKLTSHDAKGLPWVPVWILPKMDWNEHTRDPLFQLFSSQPNLQFLGANLSGQSSFCPFIERESISIAWDGSVSPCPALMYGYSYYVAGREKKIRPYRVGSLTGQRLREIWDNAEFAAFRDRVHRFDFSPCVDCGGCDMVESNETDCYGNPFPVCGDCLWGRGIIRCA